MSADDEKPVDETTEASAVEETPEAEKKPAAKKKAPAKKPAAAKADGDASEEKPAKAKAAKPKAEKKADDEKPAKPKAAKADEEKPAKAKAAKPKAAAKAKADEEPKAPAEDEPAEETPAADEAAKPAPQRRRDREPGEPVFVSARARYVRTSARKARLVCDNIRGKDVEEARAVLDFTTRAVATPWKKLLESAVANAEHNHELVGEELRIISIQADEGPTLKRFRPRAMGRATPIKKRTSHLSITLAPKE